MSTALPRTHRNQYLAVLGLALVMRLLVFWVVLAKYPSGWLYQRGIEMGLLAQSLLAGKGLSSPFGGDTGPTAFIAPVYPILVAGVFRLFGIYSHASEVVILLAQIAINLLTVALILHVTRKLFGHAAALIAGTFWACSLPLIWIPTIFWETSLSTCLLVGLIAFALYTRENPTPRTWLLLGIYSGIAALINPALLPSLIAITLWAAWESRRIARYTPLLAVLAFTVVFSPWPIRNARVFHAFIPLRTTVGFEMWMGNHEGSSGFLEENLFPMYNQQELTDYNRLGEIAYTRNKSALANTYIATHPGTFLRLTTHRILRFWTGTGTRGGSALFALHATTTTLFGFTGLFFLYRKRRDLALLLAVPLALFPAPYYITHAEFRYRLLIDPILTVLAAHAIAELSRRYAHKEDAVVADQEHLQHG